ncbi:hypothetical protein FRB93_010162 [Tulasnella sp. JGI-2019a]|nr:hypothetical protein FRB93_010162 [Tulasnella sp. JGI-2019a]
MDEKSAVTQPLLGDHDNKDVAARDLPAPVSADTPAPRQTPRQKKWRRAAKFSVLALMSIWLLHGFLPHPFDNAEDFDIQPFEHLIASHHADGEAEADFHCDRTLWNGVTPQWTTLDRAYFLNPEKFTYNLTTSADKIKIFTRGPIVGNITLSSGETTGDDIEVDIGFMLPPWKHHHKHHDHKHGDHKSGHRNQHHDHKHGDHKHAEEKAEHELEHQDADEMAVHDDEHEDPTPLEVTKHQLWTRAWRAPTFHGKKDKECEHPHKPHHPPAPPKIKVCPFYTEEGAINGLGIFAWYEHEHPPPPPPPPNHQPGDHPHRPVHSDHGPKHDGPHGNHPHGPPEHDGPHGDHPHGPPHGSPRKSPWHHGKHYHGPPPVFSQITVTFPSGSGVKDAPLVIKDFSTALAGFKYVVRDLTAVFEKLELVTIGKPIFVKSVSATFLKIVAIHGPIFGNFAASKVVELTSVGAPIKANVALHSGPHEKWYNATVFKASTSQSWISANVSLHSTSDGSGSFAPSYIVKTASSGSSTWRGHTHSGTFLDFTSQPTNTSLIVDSFTRNAPLTVSLASAFEGWYNLISPFSKPELVIDLGVEDPTGEGRTRKVTPEKSWVNFKLSGTVKWVKEELLGLEKRAGCHKAGVVMGDKKMAEGEEEPVADEEGRPAWGRVKLVSMRKPAKLILG